MNTVTTQVVTTAPAASTTAVVEAPKPIADVAVNGSSNTGLYIAGGVVILLVIAGLCCWKAFKK